MSFSGRKPYTPPKLNMLMIPSFLGQDKCKLQRTGIGSTTTTISMTRLIVPAMMYAVKEFASHGPKMVLSQLNRTGLQRRKVSMSTDKKYPIETAIVA